MAINKKMMFFSNLLILISISSCPTNNPVPNSTPTISSKPSTLISPSVNPSIPSIPNISASTSKSEGFKLDKFEGQIAFIGRLLSSDNKYTEWWIYLIDGSNPVPKKLYSTKNPISRILFSPDGKKIMFLEITFITKIPNSEAFKNKYDMNIIDLETNNRH